MNELRSYSFDFINTDNHSSSFHMDILILELKWIFYIFTILSLIQIIFELNFSLLSIIVAIISILLGLSGLVLINKYRVNEEVIYSLIEKGYYCFFFTFLCHLTDITMVIYLNSSYITFSHNDKYEKFFNKISIIFTIQTTFLLLYILSFLRKILSEKQL